MRTDRRTRLAIFLVVGMVLAVLAAPVPGGAAASSLRTSALVFSTYLGGGGADATPAIGVDAHGNIYVSGRTASEEFPTTPGALAETDPDPGSQDAFVAKLDATGTRLLWATYLGGHDVGGSPTRETEVAYRLAVDRHGNVYVTGVTNSPDFPTTPGAFQPTDPDPDEADAFVTKLSPSGSLLYSTYLGGSRGEGANAIATDGAGHAYVAGPTRSGDFPVTGGAFQGAPPAGNGRDAFVAKLSPDGSSLLFATYLGGADRDNALGVDAAPDGGAWITGFTASEDFPATQAAIQAADPDGGAGLDGFLTRLSPSGGLTYSTYLGGRGDDFGVVVTIGDDGDVYVAGDTTSTNFPVTKRAFQSPDPDVDPDPTLGSDLWVARLSPSGTRILAATYVGGSGEDFGTARHMAVDDGGAVFLTGWTQSEDFPTTPDADRPDDPDTVDPFGEPSADGFVVKLDPSLSTVTYSTYLGGTDEDFGTSISTGPRGEVSVSNRTASADFRTTPDAYQPTSGGGLDGAIARFRVSD